MYIPQALEAISRLSAPAASASYVRNAHASAESPAYRPQRTGWSVRWRHLPSAYVRCGKAGCRRCPPAGPGHGPYWYAFYWDYRQRTRSFYVGKSLPPGVELCIATDTMDSDT